MMVLSNPKECYMECSKELPKERITKKGVKECSNELPKKVPRFVPKTNNSAKIKRLLPRIFRDD